MVDIYEFGVGVGLAHSIQHGFRTQLQYPDLVEKFLIPFSREQNYQVYS